MKNEPQLLPAKIIKIDIEEVPENYLRPYILQAKPKYHKVLEIVEGMIPTQEETFTREEYQLVLFGYGKKIRQPFYVKKEFQSMFEALFNEIIATALEEQKEEVIEELLKHMRKVMFEWHGTGWAMVDDYKERFLNRKDTNE